MNKLLALINPNGHRSSQFCFDFFKNWRTQHCYQTKQILLRLRDLRNQPKTMIENRPQTIGKTQKLSSNKSSKSEQSDSIQSRPGGLREAITINVTFG